jgi:drug/metabolite transporter (DMT)-like permease
MAGFTTIMRRHREVPMLPAMALSGWLCSLFCLGFAEPLAISQADFLLCIAFGIIQNATGLALYTFGSKRVPAAEATLLAALEVPFTPFWVFLFLGETPSLQTLAGGGIVMAALFLHILSEFRRRPLAAEAPALAG